jgi:rubrerythrin
MLVKTASEGVSFARSLELSAAKFYETMAAGFDELRDFALASAAENKRFAGQIQRVYQEVITDAIEGGFCFHLETADYELDDTEDALREELDAVRVGEAIEGRMVAFFATAQEQAESLMADLPHAFARIRKRHERRLRDLEALELRGRS